MPIPGTLANRNKRGMALDLKSPDAQKVLEKLVKWADVFIVNTPHPPARKRLKLEYDDVVAVEPAPDLRRCHRLRREWAGCRTPGLRITSYLGAQRLAVDDARLPARRRLGRWPEVVTMRLP